ncbi:MAG: Flp pilus assembly protein CpaB [Anaerolinea sp.]|nr:Flp pilus assembly protein CpaB [Anaerolinea sp.]
MSNRIKIILLLVVGIILVGVGVLASIFIIQRMDLPQRNAQSQTDAVMTQVVVLTRDMFLGDKIAAADVKTIEVPIDIAPRGALANTADAVDKIIKSDLVSGEMVLQHNLADPTNTNHDLSFILADDHVMMAFPADDLISREGIIQRGDVIDIFATFEEVVQTVPNNSTSTTTTSTDPATLAAQEPQSRTFTVDTFQKVSITALVLETPTDQSGDQTTPIIKSYLLALNPQDALVLKHLKDTDATFDLVLRAPKSSVQFDLTPVTEEYIIEYYGLQVLP